MKWQSPKQPVNWTIEKILTKNICMSNNLFKLSIIQFSIKGSSSGYCHFVVRKLHLLNTIIVCAIKWDYYPHMVLYFISHFKSIMFCSNLKVYLWIRYLLTSGFTIGWTKMLIILSKYKSMALQNRNIGSSIYDLDVYLFTFCLSMESYHLFHHKNTNQIALIPHEHKYCKKTE